MSEAIETDPHRYTSFNAFFTRALRPGARPLPQALDAFISPADGTLIEFGTVTRGALLQAKGKSYGLSALLAGDTGLASELEGGTYLTVYLAPRDYHRVHSPVGASVRAVTFVPGRLFSVAARPVARVPELFARNERVVFELHTEIGRIALVMVGALCVSSVETAWNGPVTGPQDRPTTRSLHPGVSRARGEEIARFAMGSTVITVVPAGAVRWTLPEQGSALRLGQALGTLARTSANPGLARCSPQELPETAEGS